MAPLSEALVLATATSSASSSALKTSPNGLFPIRVLVTNPNTARPKPSTRPAARRRSKQTVANPETASPATAQAATMALLWPALPCTR